MRFNAILKIVSLSYLKSDELR